MNAIQIFKNPEFGEVRTTGTPENPLFCLADVARVLNLQTHKVVERLDDGVLSKYPISDSLGREQLANFVNEDGLYDVILDSRKPEAKKFRKWVTSEVLPSIRKSGGYIASNPDDTPEDILARAVLVAQESIERKNKQISELQETLNNKDQQLQIESMRVEEKQQQIEEQQKTISDLTPGYNFSRAVEASNKSILISEMAKILTQNGYVIGQNRLYKYLRDNGYLFSKGEQYNLPVQRYMEMGIFEIKKVVISQPGGTAITPTLPKLPRRGRYISLTSSLLRKEA